ncbi:hypothetical protein TNCV_3687401 [Trichonephila clavipes]|nr:hypothetical protein TNCV_3687401 [Trichonephila clavipes]
MFDPSSFTDPTPLAHADTSRDVPPLGSTPLAHADASRDVLPRGAPFLTPPETPKNGKLGVLTNLTCITPSIRVIFSRTNIRLHDLQVKRRISILNKNHCERHLFT